ncbi:MAG: aminotransferase class V-fold PLP-dependent enzyme [Actinomycetales bacterium]|nr:aminotransferase class V-fold PLP-dependent enzyme [Actinomycetales bacterium]
MTLNENGRSPGDVLSDLEARHAPDVPTHGGRTWAYVYDSGLPDLDLTMDAARSMYTAVNGLDPTVFSSIVGLENQVVGSVLDLTQAPPDAVGTFTSGGTESCMLAVKAARDARPGIARPNLVAPVTVHAAFVKGCEYFGLDIRLVPVDPVTFRADPEAMAAAMDESTVLVVCSAVSYAHGVCDPVPEIARTSAERGIPCHVDGCIGGWVLGWWRRIGLPVPEWDFAVDGVTSISVDLHKYAYASKGASTLLFRDAELRRASYFASADWPGYAMINTTMQSTKSAGPLAASWAAFEYLGADGYARLAQRTRAATDALVAGLPAIPGLRLLGSPDASLVAVASDDPRVDVFVVADEMRERGWYLQPQFAYVGLPRNLHLTVTAASLDNVEPLLSDLAESVAAARIAPSAEPAPELVEVARSLDPSTLTREEFAGLLAFAGLDPAAVVGGGLPMRMAGVNHLLEVMPPRLRERILAEFIGLLYTPVRD